MNKRLKKSKKICNNYTFGFESSPIDGTPANIVLASCIVSEYNNNTAPQRAMLLQTYTKRMFPRKSHTNREIIFLGKHQYDLFFCTFLWHFHIFDLFCTSAALIRPLYFYLCTSTFLSNLDPLLVEV